MLKDQNLQKRFKASLSLPYFLLIFCILLSFFVSCSEPSDQKIVTADVIYNKKYEFNIYNTVFIGDSNIAHLVNYGLVPKENILTGSEYYMTLEPDVFQKYVVCHKSGKEMTPADAVAFLSPDLVIITLGTDGALSLDREGFRISYISLIESIISVAPKTNIAVQSIFPIRKGARNIRFQDVKKANEKFNTANIWLSELANEYGVFYFDTASVLCDKDGYLKEEYNTDHLDGYHLNKAGLSAMLEYIKEHSKEIK